MLGAGGLLTIGSLGVTGLEQELLEVAEQVLSRLKREVVARTNFVAHLANLVNGKHDGSFNSWGSIKGCVKFAKANLEAL